MVKAIVYFPSGSYVQKVNDTTLIVSDQVLNTVVTQVQIHLPYAPVESPSLYILVGSVSDDFRRSHLDITDDHFRPKK